MAFRRIRSRLRTKIIAWSFIPTAIILFLVALALYVLYQQVTGSLVSQAGRGADAPVCQRDLGQL